MKNYFDMKHGTFQDTGLKPQLMQQFVASSTKDVFCTKTVFVLNKTNQVLDILFKIKENLTEAKLSMPYGRTTAVIEGKYLDEEALIWIDISYFSEAIKIEVELVSEPYKAEALLNKINSDFHNETMPVIKWWHKGRHGDDTKDFYLPPETNKILPEFYPDLGDPAQFLDNYMRSEESILLMAGPPGTGKTTILRHLISKYKLTAHVIYDERLMEQDGPFQAYLFGDSNTNGMPMPATGVIDEEPPSLGGDIMIIEDADTILMSREDDGNKLMSRFLNVADGLINLPNKKLIFTTNITDFTKVDPALLRPGRCFGVMHTRLMNLTEAQAAAKAANMPIPMEKREYSLAEIFNQGKSQTVRTVGFGVRHA